MQPLSVVDAHCGGEPARVVLGGLPEVPGATMNEKREYMME
jgi:proline racemase